MLRRASWSLALALLTACGPGDAPAPDAAVDAAGADAGAVCQTDAVCDDGRFCNGVERCRPEDPGALPSGCVAGQTPCGAEEGCTESPPSCVIGCEDPDLDGDGSMAIRCGGDDCDDSDPNRFPGNPEVCDALDHDEDCDLTTSGPRDSDGDGYDDDRCCNVDDDGVRRCGRDCNDAQPSISPVAADDDCDGVDDDCDTIIDEDGGPQNFFADADGDGFGAGAPTQMCAREVEGFATAAGDCDDGNPDVNPAATELCNGVDDDCNGDFDGPGEDEDGDRLVNADCGGGDCYDGDPVYGCEANGWLIGRMPTGRDIDVADMDEDGYPEVAVAYGSNVQVYRNPVGPDPLRAAWPTLDPSLADRVIDTSRYEAVRIVELDSGGGFPRPRELLVSEPVIGGSALRYYIERSELGWREMGIADFNAHALATGTLGAREPFGIAAVGSSQGVSLFRRRVDGGFDRVTLLAGESGFRDEPLRVELADVNDDGRTDVVVGYDFWNPEGGSLVSGDSGRIDVFYAGAGSRGGFGRVEVATGIDLRGLAVGDLDMDGDVDLAFVGVRAEVSWFEQNADRTFTPHQLAGPGRGEPSMWRAGVEIADLDGDGRNELLAGGINGTVRHWTDVVAGTERPRVTLGANATWRIFARDVDGDSDLDVVVLTGSLVPGPEVQEEVYWIENRGGQLAPTPVR